MENSGKRRSDNGDFNTSEKRLKTHHGDDEKQSFGRILWKLNGQVTGISVGIRGLVKAPAVEKKKAKQSIKRTRTDAKRWIGCFCHDGVDASAQCHQPLSTSRCQGLRSKLLQMGVKNIICCLRKRITKSDIDRGQHRLLVPNDLLNKPALKGMMTADEDRRTMELSGLEARTLDKAGRVYKLTLRFLANINAYRVIGRGYTRLVEDNGFRPGQLVDLLVFRVPPRDEFAMAIIEYDEAEQVSASAAAAAAEAKDIVSLCGYGEMASAADSILSFKMALEGLLQETREGQSDENNSAKDTSDPLTSLP